MGKKLEDTAKSCRDVAHLKFLAANSHDTFIVEQATIFFYYSLSFGGKTRHNGSNKDKLTNKNDNHTG